MLYFNTNVGATLNRPKNSCFDFLGANSHHFIAPISWDGKVSHGWGGSISACDALT